MRNYTTLPTCANFSSTLGLFAGRCFVRARNSMSKIAVRGKVRGTLRIGAARNDNRRLARVTNIIDASSFWAQIETGQSSLC